MDETGRSLLWIQLILNLALTVNVCVHVQCVCINDLTHDDDLLV